VVDRKQLIRPAFAVLVGLGVFAGPALGAELGVGGRSYVADPVPPAPAPPGLMFGTFDEGHKGYGPIYLGHLNFLPGLAGVGAGSNAIPATQMPDFQFDPGGNGNVGVGGDALSPFPAG
jgi:hypothetical protein